jgi:hypothetical protein
MDMGEIKNDQQESHFKKALPSPDLKQLGD